MLLPIAFDLGDPAQLILVKNDDLTASHETDDTVALQPADLVRARDRGVNAEQPKAGGDWEQVRHKPALWTAAAVPAGAGPLAYPDSGGRRYRRCGVMRGILTFDTERRRLWNNSSDQNRLRRAMVDNWNNQMAEKGVMT